MYRNTILLSMMVHCCAFLVQAQVYKHREFNTTDGLSSTTIYHAVQDKQGYIWFATDAGVTKFDGAHFHAYYKNDGIMDNDVIHLLIGEDGKVGFMTYNGRFSYYSKGKIYNPTNTVWLRKAQFDHAIVAGFEDSKGRIWLGSKDGTIYSLSPNGLVAYGKQPTQGNQKASFAHFFHEDSKANIWIDGCYKIIKNKIVHIENRFEFEPSNAFYRNESKKNELLFLAKEGIVRCVDTLQTLILPRSAMADSGEKQYGYLLEDRDGSIWVPTIGNGIYKYSKDKNGTWQPPLRYLSDAKVSTALQDHEGNIWFCLLGEGLYMLPSNYQSAVTYSQQNKLDYDRVGAVLEDKKGNIWCGMDDATLNIIPPKGEIQTLFVGFGNAKDRAYQNILHLKEDKKGKIWAMTPSRIAFYLPKGNDGFEQTIVENPDKLTFKSWAFAPDGRIALAYSRGVAWLTEQNGKWRITKEANIPNKITYSVFADTKQRIWVANIDGLNCFHNNKCTNWAKYNPLFREKIKSMAELPNGTLVLAAEGYGLLLLKDTLLVEQLSLKNEFENNIFKQLLVRDSTIWCTGNHGLARIFCTNTKLGRITTYHTSEGLASDEVIDVFVTKWEAMVATAKGLTILQTNTNDDFLPAPSIFILNKIKNAENIFLKDILYPNNTASIHFEAVALREPNSVQYRYRFSPTQAWQYANHNNNSVSLSQLQAGAYRFEVQAQHLNSAWSMSDSLAFEIQPFWWQTTWFWLCCTATILGAATYIVLRYTKKQQQIQTERLQAEKKMIELEQQALQGMMNPHFVFNVMNSVQYFLNHNNKEAANRYLTQFARMLRTNLEISNKPTIRLEEEISYLNLYLSLEKLRCGTTLNYVFNIDEDLDTSAIVLPPMLLQPYIENAIWHGIMPNKENYNDTGGIITIEISEPQPDVLQITITDDGIGIDNSKATKANSPSKHHSIALTLTAERLRILAELTQKPYSVTMQQKSANGGTEVRLLLAII